MKTLTTRLYNALFLSILRYGIIAWGGIAKNAINSLQILQNYALKKIYSRPKLYEIDKLYKETKSLNIKQIFVTRAIIKLATDGFHNKEDNKKSIATRNATNQKVRIPKCEKRIGDRSYKTIGFSVINLIPKTVRINLLNFEKILYYKLKNETENGISDNYLTINKMF